LCHHRSRRWRSLTVEITLDLEESHAEPQHRQLVQTTPDLPGERQHAGEALQLSIQTVPVALGRIGLHGRRLGAETTRQTKALC